MQPSEWVWDVEASCASEMENAAVPFQNQGLGIPVRGVKISCSGQKCKEWTGCRDIPRHSVQVEELDIEDSFRIK